MTPQSHSSYCSEGDCSSFVLFAERKIYATSNNKNWDLSSTMHILPVQYIFIFCRSTVQKRSCQKKKDISLDPQASSNYNVYKKTIIIIKLTDIPLDRHASYANDCCRSSEISINLIIIVVFVCRLIVIFVIFQHLFMFLCCILDVYLSLLFVCTESLTLVSDRTTRRFISWPLFQTFIYICIYICKV